MRPRVRLLRFWLVGLGGIAAQMASLYGLTAALGLHYAAATVVAVGVALVHNFLWHRAWTWMDRDLAAPLPAFARFVAANGVISILGNVGVMWVLVGLTGMPAVPANAIAIGVCGVANYWMADRVVFGRAQGSGLTPQAPSPGLTPHPQASRPPKPHAPSPKPSASVPSAFPHRVRVTPAAKACTTTTSPTQASQPPRVQTNAGSAAPALPPA